MTDCDLCTCIPNILQSIQINLLSSLHNIFHITTDVHIQSLGDFLFLLIDLCSRKARPKLIFNTYPISKNSMTNPFCLLQENTILSIPTADMNYQTLPLCNQSKFHFTKHTRQWRSTTCFPSRCKHSKCFSNTSCTYIRLGFLKLIIKSVLCCILGKT